MVQGIEKTPLFRTAKGSNDFLCRPAVSHLGLPASGVAEGLGVTSTAILRSL